GKKPRGTEDGILDIGIWLSAHPDENITLVVDIHYHWGPVGSEKRKERFYFSNGRGGFDDSNEEKGWVGNRLARRRMQVILRAVRRASGLGYFEARRRIKGEAGSGGRPQVRIQKE